MGIGNSKADVSNRYFSGLMTLPEDVPHPDTVNWKALALLEPNIISSKFSVQSELAFTNLLFALVRVPLLYDVPSRAPLRVTWCVSVAFAFNVACLTPSRVTSNESWSLLKPVATNCPDFVVSAAVGDALDNQHVGVLVFEDKGGGTGGNAGLSQLVINMEQSLRQQYAVGVPDDALLVYGVLSQGWTATVYCFVMHEYVFVMLAHA